MTKQAVTHFPVLRKAPRVRRLTSLALGPTLTLPIAAVTIFLMASSTEPWLTAASIVVLIIGAKLLWRVGEPPILFAAFFLQWMQVSLLVMRASFTDIRMTNFYFPPGIFTATWLSLGGLLVLAGGIRLMVGKAAPGHMLAQFRAEVWQYSPQKAFVSYLVAQVVVVGIDRVTWLYSGLSQVFLALSAFRWVFFFVLAVIVMIQRRGYILLAFVFMFELMLGFMSFFSDFKQVFLVFAVAALTARPKVNARIGSAVVAIFAVVLVLLAGWSVVKIQYRDYLSAGTGKQTVLMAPMERLYQIVDLMWTEGLPNLGAGFERLARRIEYTYYFGAAVDYVPASTPHTGGEIWGKTIIHVLTPRLLFPDKPPLEADVVNTKRYTGLNITADETIKDTEVPMGYMAESYIDFGPYWMFAPIFFLGLLYGAQYRYLANIPRYKVFAYGAMPVVLQPFATFEMTSVKIVGGSLVIFAATYIALRVVAPLVHRWMRAKRYSARI
jgi:hypothetical protein